MQHEPLAFFIGDCVDAEPSYPRYPERDFIGIRYDPAGVVMTRIGFVTPPSLCYV